MSLCRLERHDAAHLQVVHLLLERGADANAANGKFGLTALALALDHANCQLAEAIIDPSVDLNARTVSQALKRLQDPYQPSGSSGGYSKEEILHVKKILLERAEVLEKQEKKTKRWGRKGGIRVS